MTVTIISYLSGKGIIDSEVGRLSALVALPWAFKFVWAPLIDSFEIPTMGRRRPWIIVAQLGMAISLLGFLILYDPTGNIAFIGWIFFAHNCFASLQDVLSDALAIDVLPKEELSKVNGLMVASKSIGIGAGAAGLALIMHYWGLGTAVLGQFLLLVLIMLLPLLILERPGDTMFPWKGRKPNGERPRIAISSPLRVLKDLQRAFWVKTIVALALFGCVASISEWLVEVINKPFYTKVLGWTFVKFSAVSGALLLLQVAAAIAGGWAASRLGARTIIAIGLGAYGLLAFVFGAFNQFLINTWFPVVFLFLPPAANAFGSVAFYSLAMRVSWTRSAATVFTSIMAITSFGHVIGGWLISWLRGGLDLSYGTVYCLGGGLMICSLFLLFAIDPAQVDVAKHVEGQA
jgi:PAT family beta-lactamase induction signal transducer AmpG